MPPRRGKPARRGAPGARGPRGPSDRGPSARGARRPSERGQSPSHRRTRRHGEAADRPKTPPVRPASRRSVAPGAIDQALARQPWDLLRAPLLQAGVDADEAIERLRRYARLLLEWNRSASNLISRNDELRIVERHLLESVAPAHWLRETGCATWIDFGSGAGLPAIPLVVGGVPGPWTLVESRRTKTLFIRKAVLELGLGQVVTENDRLENVAANTLGNSMFDGFTSRATMKLIPTLALAAPLVAPGGSAFLWKGSGRDQEMGQEARWREAWEFTGLLGVGSGPNVVCRFVRRTT